MVHADWIIDLGPGAGHDGGRIVFEGTHADLARLRRVRDGVDRKYAQPCGSSAKLSEALRDRIRVR
jgi:excinuclease UvrABC ATPase subunit